MEKRPWYPTIDTYPTLLLDASRVANDGEEPERMSVPASLSSERLSNAVRMRATQPPDPIDAEPSPGYVPERVWSGDLSSGLC
jgi:hypothetical protein